MYVYWHCLLTIGTMSILTTDSFSVRLLTVSPDIWHNVCPDNWECFCTFTDSVSLLTTGTMSILITDIFCMINDTVCLSWQLTGFAMTTVTVCLSCSITVTVFLSWHVSRCPCPDMSLCPSPDNWHCVLGFRRSSFFGTPLASCMSARLSIPSFKKN
jgi:hypothetical protein